jgi:hypothetical protein
MLYVPIIINALFHGENENISDCLVKDQFNPTTSRLDITVDLHRTYNHHHLNNPYRVNRHRYARRRQSIDASN